MARSLNFRSPQVVASLVCCGVGVIVAACGSATTAQTEGVAGAGNMMTGTSGQGPGTGGNGNAGAGNGTSGTAGANAAGGTAGANPAGGTGGANPAGGTGGANPQGGADPGGAGPGGAANGGATSTGYKNYQMTGSWPNIPMALATVAGSLSYDKIVVHTRFLAESCSIADYNGDNMPDISSGRRWYEGPAFTTEHIFRDGHEDLPRIGEPRDEIDTGVSDDWADYPWDVTGDGIADIINVANCDVDDAKNPNPAPTIQSHATAWVYENPGGAAAGAGTNWAKHQIAGDIRHEQKGLVDVNGDGQPELFGACKGCMPNNTKGYYFNDWTNPNGAWNYQPVIMGVDFPFGGTGWMHGLGFGDVNGDGNPDMLSREGAYISPVTPGGPASSAGAWTQLAQQLWDGDPQPQRGGSHMFTGDFDGDGDMDIFSPKGAHHWGLSWYEQTAPGAFTEHQFMGTVEQAGTYPDNGGIAFSEPHAAQVADMDGDGILDVVAGKMRYAHPIAEGDPDAQGTCATAMEGCTYDATGKCTGPGNSCNYLVVFKGVRDPGGFKFVAHKVDAESGVGRQFSVGHANADGIPDICVASKLGLYVFLGKP